MSGKKRSFRFHMAIYALGAIGSRLIGFLMLPIYTRKLTPVDYGVYDLLAITTYVLGIVFEAGIRSSVMRFYHRYEDLEKKKLVVSTAALFMGGTMSVGLLVLLFSAPVFAHRILGVAGGTYFFRLVFITLFTDLVGAVPLSYFQAEERSSLVVSLSLLRLFLGLSLNILFVVGLEMGVEGILWSGVINGVVALTISTYLAFKRTGFGFDRKILGQMLLFGIPYIPASLSYLILHFGDRYFLRRFAGLHEVGIYALAYRFGMVISALLGEPFQRVFVTRGVKLMEEGALDKICRIVDGYVLIVMWAWVAISVVIEDVLSVVVGVDFRTADALVPFLVFAYVLRALADTCTMSIFFKYATKKIAAIRMLTAGVCLALYAALIPPFGALGAALATVGAFGFMTWRMYVEGQRLHPVPYNLMRTLRLFLVALATILGCRSLPLESGWLRFLLFSVVALAYPFLADWRGTVRLAAEARGPIMQWVRTRGDSRR